MNREELYYLIRHLLGAWAHISERDDLFEELNALDLSTDELLDDLIGRDVLPIFVRANEEDRARFIKAIEVLSGWDAAKAEDLFQDVDIYFESVPYDRLLCRLRHCLIS